MIHSRVSNSSALSKGISTILSCPPFLTISNAISICGMTFHRHECIASSLWSLAHSHPDWETSTCWSYIIVCDGCGKLFPLWMISMLSPADWSHDRILPTHDWTSGCSIPEIPLRVSGNTGDAKEGSLRPSGRPLSSLSGTLDTFATYSRKLLSWCRTHRGFISPRASMYSRI